MLWWYAGWYLLYFQSVKIVCLLATTWIESLILSTPIYCGCQKCCGLVVTSQFLLISSFEYDTWKTHPAKNTLNPLYPFSLHTLMACSARVVSIYFLAGLQLSHIPNFDKRTVNLFVFARNHMLLFFKRCYKKGMQRPRLLSWLYRLTIFSFLSPICFLLIIG